MVAKGNYLHRQFSFSDDDFVLDYLDLQQNQLVSVAPNSLDWPAFVSSFGAALGPANVEGDAVASSDLSQPHSGSTGTAFAGPFAPTGNPVLDALLATGTATGANGKWDNSKPITYFFDDTDSVSAWTSVEKATFRSALQVWADVTNVHFVETSDISAANYVPIKVYEPGNPHLFAFSQFPNPSNQVFFGFNLAAGAVGGNEGAWAPDNFGAGGIERMAMIHEIGHALGLAHPHDNGGGSTILSGVDAPFYDYGDNDLDQNIFTIMGYNQGYKSVFGTTTDGFTGDGIFAYGQAATPMPLDVAAIQYIYGANPEHNSGNNTYLLPTSNSPGTDWVGIYDTGCTDQIINPGNAPSTISLVAATIDESGTGGSLPSYVNGVNGGFTIDQNSVIENATGGNANDTIIGNRIDNILNGNNGDDIIFGAGGNDTVFGGPGNDTLYGDAGPEGVSGVGFGSGLIVNPTGNTSFATALDVTNSFSLSTSPDIANSTTVPHVTISMTAPATGNLPDPWFAITVNPNSTITVDIDHTTNIDTFILLYGSDGRGLTFNDDSTVDPGSPFVYSFHHLPYSLDSAFSLKAVAGGTYYLQIGNTQSNSVPNSASFDVNISVSNPPALGKDGVAGNDFLSGGSGNDVLNGGPGNDLLSGGSGNDMFVFDQQFGNDTITDFDTKSDVVQFNHALFANYAAVMGSAQQEGHDTVITYDKSNAVTLDNVAIASLQPSNFQFT
jgi:Ca2+-binding RTX toxin-like protein